MNFSQEALKNAVQNFVAPVLKKGFQFEALHEYQDLEGRPLYWRIRLKNPETGEKWIRPIHFNQTSGYLLEEPKYSQGKPLYNLYKLAMKPEETVFICEGEWCVDKLASLKVLATTSGSSNSATAADWQPLAGRQIIIWRDNDKAGQQFAAAVILELQKLGCSIQQIDVDVLQLPEKGDVVDWLKQHPDAGKNDIMSLSTFSPAVHETDFKIENTGANQGEEKSLRPSRSSTLVNFLLPRVELFHDENDLVYAKSLITGEIWRLSSQRLWDWVVANFYKSTGKCPGETSVREALSTLSGLARYEGNCHPVFIRVAQQGENYYLDLAEKGSNRAVRITAGHWEIVNNPPVYFLRPETMRPLPEPDLQGELDMLWQLVNIPQGDQILIIAWLLECLRPDTPFPILELIGEQGSAKSTTQSMLRQLIDPNTCNLRAAPRNVEDVFVSAGVNWLLSYENISHLSSAIQDNLCIIATGGAAAKRKYYTDADEAVVMAKRPIILNGIGAAITAQDLVDRALSIETPRIKCRMETPELYKKYQIEQPQFLGALLNIFSRALAFLPSIQLPEDYQPRLAEFARLGMAVSVAMNGTGNQFLERFKERRQEAIARTIDASPIASALIEWFETNGKRTVVLPVNALFMEVPRNKSSHVDAWPRSAKGFADALRRAAPALRELEIECHSLGKRGGHITKLMEPHAETLVQKVIELALAGDMNALRLCVERLIPKVHHSPINISLENLCPENITDFKNQIIQAALDGTINSTEAEGLIKLVNSQVSSRHPAAIPTRLPIDPIEAARIYQQIMMAD